MTMSAMHLVKDPVCGMEVNPEMVSEKSEHMGTTYYFCSPGCKTAFDKSPAQYAEGHGGMEHGGHHM